MDKSKIIRDHLLPTEYIEGNITIFSSLAAAIRDARRVTGRNMLSGELNNDSSNADCWLGVAAYFIVLDQIGECYKNSLVERLEGNAITKSLKYFSNLDKPDIDVLYGLRCCILHDYSVTHVAVDRFKRISSKKPHFTFQLRNFGPIIEHATIRWEGEYTKERVIENETRINVIEFGNLVENVYFKVCELYLENKLELALQGGTDELKRRYMMFSMKLNEK